MDGQSGTFNILEMQTFYNLVIDDTPTTAGTFNLNSALDVNGTVTITGGTLDVTGSLWPVNIAGSWINSDTFTARTGTVTFDPPSGTSSINMGTSNLYHVVIDDNAGTGTVQLSADMDVNGSFSLDDGTFAQGATSDLNVAGNFTIASVAAFTKATGAGTLTFDGDLFYTDNTSPVTDVGRVVIGSSPDLVCN